MNAYSIVEVIHVIVAVSGLGSLTVIALMARKPEWASVPLLTRLFKVVGPSFGLMLLTGIALLWIAGWVYASTGWFRAAFLLFIVLGALTGIAQSTLKKIAASGTPFGSSPLLGKFRTLTLWANILLILIVFLMEGKPF
ncbi:MAG TPA: hypothetical protein VFD13_01705 [Candidatus Kapabacteria bacterium]|nr:hypothetical protein [Candidatus Kapabacteria bacterium]